MERFIYICRKPIGYLFCILAGYIYVKTIYIKITKENVWQFACLYILWFAMMIVAYRFVTHDNISNEDFIYYGIEGGLTCTVTYILLCCVCACPIALPVVSSVATAMSPMTPKTATPKSDNSRIKRITPDELLTKPLSGYRISRVTFGDEVTHPYYLKTLLAYIYATLSADIILKNTTLNVVRGECNNSGYTYYPKAGVSVKVSDASRILGEIIKIAPYSNRRLEMELKLTSGDFIVSV